MECGARKKDGTLCKAKAMSNGKCRIHGGKSLAGIASPTFKTGRHSKYLPVSLMDTYHEHLADDDRLVLNSEIALVDVRISELVEGIGDYDSGDLWYKLYEQRAKYLSENDGVEKTKALAAILGLIEMGASYTSKWSELFSHIEQRRKLVESERKRIVEGQQTIQAGQALVLVTALLNAVKSNITDTQTLSAIQSEFNRLVGANRQ